MCLLHTLYFYYFAHSILTGLNIELSDCDLSFLLWNSIAVFLHLFMGDFFIYPNSYASVVLEDLFGSRKELIDLDSIGKLLTFLSLDLCVIKGGITIMHARQV